MRYFCAVLLMLLTVAVNAQTNYNVDIIPKELLARASAVVRNDETLVDVKDLNSVNYHFKQAVTVLNKNGDNEAGLAVWHDKSRQIRYIKGAIFDEFGKLKGKISESDFDDQNVGDGALFDGTKIKHFKPAVTTYPYTVEYDYEIHDKQSLLLEDWKPYVSAGISVEHSSYKLTSKHDFIIHYKEINFPGKVVTTETPATKTYVWAVDNIKAIRNEPLSPEIAAMGTSVKIAPENFNYEGISGNFTNWNEYGGWIYNKLLKGRGVLPQQTVQHIKDITAGIADTKQKARIVYEYMQQKTRYVSVQVGLGGFQPFLASDVDNLGYGDCKALVNYTQSLLDVAGIESYYVLVRSGTRKKSALPDFASMNQFDHVILCLPFKNDTTWLECTNQQMPFGYLGDFTDDRNVIACTPKGGILLHTPIYKPTDNKQTRKAAFTINAAGELNGEMVTKFEGSQYDNREYLVKEPIKEQIKMLKEVYPVDNLEIQSFNLKQDKGIKPVATESIKLQARDYMAQNGDRYFLMPNIANRDTKPIKEITNRNNPVYINRGYIDEDEVNYILPEGYKLSTSNLNISINKPFGKYTATTQLQGNTLIYKRNIQINDGTYGKDAYQDVVDFYQSVYEADHYTITMEKK